MDRCAVAVDVDDFAAAVAVVAAFAAVTAVAAVAAVTAVAAVAAVASVAAVAAVSVVVAAIVAADYGVYGGEYLERYESRANMPGSFRTAYMASLNAVDMLMSTS